MNFKLLTSLANTNTFVKLNSNDRPPKSAGYGDNRPPKANAKSAGYGDNRPPKANAKSAGYCDNRPPKVQATQVQTQATQAQATQTQATQAQATQTQATQTQAHRNANYNNKHNAMVQRNAMVQHNAIAPKKNFNIPDNNVDMDILVRFPSIKLSYDKIIHTTNVYSDLYSIIPKGNKYYLWITYKNDKNVCLLLSISRTGTIQHIENYSLCFSDCLALGQGTILYGTCFDLNGYRHFTCEDIYYYQGKKLDLMPCVSKLELLDNLFTYYIHPKVYSIKSVIVGIPIYTRNINEANDICKILPYKVYGIRHHTYSGVWSNGITIVKEKSEGIFKVKANIQQDIYELYCYDGGNVNDKPLGNVNDKPLGNAIPYGIAFIPDYKSSVMMNTLFRNIKENRNLDLLEESDDEEEFEDVREDKFVYLDKTYYMKCVYNTRFKKWQPIEVIREKSKLITMKEASLLEQQ
jgi:hypothetical protein